MTGESATTPRREFWSIGLGNSRQMVVTATMSLDLEIGLWQNTDRLHVPDLIPVEVTKLVKPIDMPAVIPFGCMVSHPLRDLLLQFESRMLEFYPTQLTSIPDGAELGPYYMMQCRRVVACHHPEHTEVHVNGSAKTMSNFVLDHRRLPARAHILKLQYRRTKLLVSDELKRAIEQHKLTGCSFYDTDDRVIFAKNFSKQRGSGSNA